MDEFEAQLNRLLVDVFNQLLRYEEASVKSAMGTTVTVSEAHILEVIGKRSGRITAGEIASTLSITAPTVTVALKKLESKGFVTKTPCTDDGRRSMIGLTDKGKKLCRAHDLFHSRMVREMSRGLDGEEKRILISGVKKLSDFFRAQPGKKSEQRVGITYGT